MVASTDYDALTAAIDSGDDTALLALADWLEEQGDPLAAGLRLMPRLVGRIGHVRPERRTDWQPIGWAWRREHDTAGDGRFAFCGPAYELPAAVFDRIPSAAQKTVAAFATRSSAYFALAEALAEVNRKALPPSG